MTFEEYQEARRTTDKYEKHEAPYCHGLGLCSEAGEVAGKIDKLFRSFHFFAPQPDQKKALAKELGDVLWFLTACADDIGYELREIAEMNIHKLADRDRRDQIQSIEGGDDR